MKKRWLPYIIFGLVFYLLFLVIEMPASWFAWGLNRYTGGTVRLDPIAGSLWHGNGKLVMYYPPTVPHDLGATEWRINPLWLFTGQIQTIWRTDSADARINTTLRLSSGKVTLVDTDAAFPAQSIGAFYPAASLISPTGQIRLHTDKFAIGPNGIEGSGEILWQSAGSNLSSVQSLGEYRMEITGTGKAANLKLTTIHGALELTGQGQYQLANRQIQLTGFAMPREHKDELEPLLKLMGNDEGNGKRPLILNGRFTLM